MSHTFLYISLLMTGWALQSMATPTASTQLPACPHQCTCTDNNLSVDCSNRGLVRLPQLSGQITKLDLSGNLLGPMINGSFEHLRQLEEVDLSNNGFLRLQLCTFTGLLHLRKVDLHGNRLSSLPISLFADNGAIQVLDLSYNEMDALPDLLLGALPQLKVLNVSHNQATFLKLGLRFQSLTQLAVLDLSHNPFTNASQNAFETAQAWNDHVPRSLDLSYCQLQEIHPQALTALRGLRKLSLEGNWRLSFQQVVNVLQELQASGLQDINLSNMNISNPALFSQVTLMALHGLDLSGNAITTVPAATFGNIRSLRRLDISRNLMTGLDQGFEDLVNLVQLNISHCRLSSFKGPQVGRMQLLTSLDLSHNHLLQATEVDLSALRTLQTLDLSYNMLQAVVLPGDCSQLVTLSFTSNALTSLPSMSNMRRLKYFSACDNNIQSLSEFLFTEASDILVANFSNNDLATIDHRAFLPRSPRAIDLSHNFLTRTQFFSWTDTKEVYLQHNKLNALDQQTFYGMDRLQVLDLGHNNLSVLHEETFKFLSNLTTLRLSNNSLQMSSFSQLFRSMALLQELDFGFNKIAHINASSFHPLVSLESLSLAKNRLKVIPVQLFHDMEKLTQVDISGNPFDCDCELLPLQEWLLATQVKVKQRFDLNLTNTCVSPASQRGKMVTMFTVGQFQCDTKLLYLIIFGSIGGFVILVGILTSLLCHYCSKRKKNQAPETPGHKHKKLKEDNTSRKETNQNRVDLVRVSKRPDPYGKEELINGWLASKQFTTAKHNVDFQHQKKLQQGPTRPPWPEHLLPQNKKEDKVRKQRRKDKDLENKPRRDNPDKRLRSVSELVPVRPSPHYARSPSLVPVWGDVYYEKPRRNRKPKMDQWVDVDPYPTWTPPRAMRTVDQRDEVRCYTLPYPIPFPRYAPYGPDYPYRGRRPDPEEEERYQARQARALPYPPRQHDPSTHDPQPPITHRNNQRLNQDPHVAERIRDYENLRESREESQRLAHEERMYRDFVDTRQNRQGYETDGKSDDRQADPRRSNGERKAEDRGEGQGDTNQRQAAKKETSDAQVHKRDDDYRTAMENQVGPKDKPTEEKASDWL